jgi:pyruvate/2-oxoacid:ferredoxin oxidoreductase beta subunit
MTDTATRHHDKDWSSDQEVRWCPGCGDYSILAAVQMLMPELGVNGRTPCSCRGSAARPGSPIT